MTGDDGLAILYLFVSVESVLIQIGSLVRLRGGRRDQVHRHLVRTVGTRVVVMSVYVGVAVDNLLTHSLLSPSGTAIFTAVAIVWQLNSLADARLGRELANNNQSGGPE
jgi:hypothetical protein